MIVVLRKKATPQNLKKASEEFGDYIKIVVDLKRRMVAIGGRLHSDAEKVHLQEGSLQKDIWGGGFDIKSGRIDTQAVINIRPNQKNDSMEILDPKTRNKFIKIAQRFLK